MDHHRLHPFSTRLSPRNTHSSSKRFPNLSHLPPAICLVQTWSISHASCYYEPVDKSRSSVCVSKMNLRLACAKPPFHSVQKLYTRKKSYPTCSKYMRILGRPHASASITVMMSLPISADRATPRSIKPATYLLQGVSFNSYSSKEINSQWIRCRTKYALSDDRYRGTCITQTSPSALSRSL